MKPGRVVAAIVLSLAALAPIGGASAQERRPPDSAAEMKLSFAPVVRRVTPAVVNIYATRTERRRSAFLDDPFFRQFFGEGRGLGRERVQRSLGSGAIVGEDGLVVTNNHVIEGMTEVKVALSDKREFEARILIKDPRTDLAVLKIGDGAEKFPTLGFADSDALMVGDLVLAVGNPFGVGQTVTSGIVSAVARTQVGVSDYQSFIQTDAAINPGNSGGALVDLDGKLVGINTAIFSQSGGSVGIGFAIPANMVRVVLASARSGAKAVTRPWFGASLQAVTPEIADSLGLKHPGGALIANVAEGSPAAAAGLKAGDLITAVDGRPVDDVESFHYRFATRPLGGLAEVTASRDGRDRAVKVALQAAPETPARDVRRITGYSPFGGASVANLSPALAEELSMDGAARGVVVMETEDGSPAQQLGFQKGDVVREVNDARVASSADLARVARANPRYWKVTIERGGRTFTTVFGG
ncbi:serine protease [Methylopila jiangsuensis]|uniref:Serine protease n=1 Tax=Methylopila jiangsuensis TaxID=586230 RepID=A0A9W6N3D0_9HYPH|nr:DegQ family serine endoprotease [Methylopila jiangsuensis]MDR6284314.1 Do/DeqQ family serine protease [Methylopila jiangsuensis]GLK76168.1 serine protease [Methylopila jiangsuensis]